MGAFNELLHATLSGSAYGLTAVVVSHPFDTIKTKQQAEPRFQHASASRTASVTLREEGIRRGLYKGFVPAAAGSMAFRALPFTVYSFVTNRLGKGKHGTWWECQPLLLAFVGGACGGVARAVVECPLEVIKVRKQAGGAPLPGLFVGSKTGGGLPALKATQLFQGFGATAARNASVVGLFWVLMRASDGLRRRVTDNKGLQSFLGGAGCSTMAWLTVYPLDVLKSRAQSGHFSTAGSCQGAANRESAPRRVGALRNVFRAGLRGGGLYAGFGAGVVRSVFANGIAMVVYDLCKEALQGKG